MSVKLGRVVFVRIKGRIIPIRKGITIASKAVSEMGDDVVKYSHQKVTKKLVETFKKTGKILTDNVTKLGSGVDFTVFKSKSNNLVMKLPKNTVGTANKALIKRVPEVSDKIAVSKALADNLPNYGIPTIETDVVRLGKKTRALVQEKQSLVVDTGERIQLRKNVAYTQKEAEKIRYESGLNLDTHIGNFTKQGYLLDSGGNLKKSSSKKILQSDLAKEILGIDNNYGTTLKENFNKATTLTESAAVEGKSSAILRKLNGLKKQGFRLKTDDGTNFKLLNPQERILRAEKSGIVFKKVNGKLTPTRGKK